ncbi:MAG: hypothetical protein ACM3X4_08435 [Ignavibacteriales bacterium]
MYLSELVNLVGTNIYFGSGWAWLGALAALAGILVRIPVEERRLQERFGAVYVAYISRRGMHMVCPG